MKDKIVNRLVSVKSIVTILLVLVFCYLSIIGVVSSELFMSVFSTVVAFYFGTQHQKEGSTTK